MIRAMSESCPLSKMQISRLARTWQLPRWFVVSSHDAIHINNDEVDEGRFWSRKEIEQNADANIFTPNFLHEYNRLLKKIK